MTNFIRKYLQGLEERKKKQAREKTKRQLIMLFGAFEQASESRLVFIDTPNRRVLISDVLCSSLAKDKEKWQTFFRNVGLWVQYKLGQEQWNARRLAVESKAIREAKKKYANLSKEEERIIRQKAMESFVYEEPEPIRDEYEFCICDGILRSDTKAEAVGVWKDGVVTMKVEIW